MAIFDHLSRALDKGVDALDLAIETLRLADETLVELPALIRDVRELAGVTRQVLEESSPNTVEALRLARLLLAARVEGDLPAGP